MTLEDFFTLTEMKDGLTSVARVRELVKVMQTERDFVVKNVGDATRQWSTVASTITATEDKECLDLFIQLDGLWFFNRWLKDAQKLVDGSDSFVEDSVNALLQAIGKMNIDNEKSVSSGIWLTVESLLGHKSSTVQDQARALFDFWKLDKDNNLVPQDVQNGGGTTNDGKDGNAGTAGESGHSELSKGGMMTSKTCDALKKGTMHDIEISNSVTSELAATMHGLPDPPSSSVISYCTKDCIPVDEDPVRYHAKGPVSLDTCSSVSPKQGSIKGLTDVESVRCVDDSKHIVRNCPENSASGQLEVTPMSVADGADAQKPVTESGLQMNNDANELCVLENCLDDDDTDVPEEKVEDEIGFLNHSKSPAKLRILTQSGGECNDVFLNNSGTESRGQDTCSLMVEDIGADEVSKNSSDEDVGTLVNDSDFYKQFRNSSRASDLVDKRSDIELDYGMVDPLEVARQVAIEVEREVIHGSEPSCSSSAKLSDENQQPHSPESIDGKQSQSSDRSPKECSSGSELSAEGSSPGKETIGSPSRSLDVETINQEPEGTSDKGPCDFDLNQDFYSEETDRPLNPISLPIPIVSASRAVAVPGLPFAPLQFEGTLGWKGSAATSAFRPASPRRIPECDKALNCGEDHFSLKHNNCLDIDLNVAESEDDKAIGQKQIAGLLSGDLCMGASPGRSERLNLDLNSVSDDGDTPSDWTIERQSNRHGSNHQNQSSSRLSSLLQPSLRNIDLNDRPTFVNDSTDRPDFCKSSQNFGSSRWHKSDDPVVTIMGMRVEVNRNATPQPTPLPNGRIPEPAMDVNLARSGVVLGMGSSLPFTHSTGFGYNSLAPGPSVAFSSTLIGGPGGGFIPYMVDSRGTPVVPQIVGPGPAITHTFPRTPFIMTGTPSTNGAGPSRQTLDLNSGLMIDEGCRDTGALRQLLHPAQGSSMGDTSVISGKRKEPDTGRELYQLNYKHHQPPWK